ncbi:MAG TPA: carboxymuconolactone decarboxylase family protein [Bacillus sp. (in: firmicutes)]|nr:carboxymuconolactone decarboxylase family protein [Bacillus sp. (in: firmicutes)]
MENDRFQRGLDKLTEYTNEEEVKNLVTSDKLKEIAPDLRRYIIEFGYGDIYTRPGLDNKQRALITLSSLVTQGANPQMETHINRGLTAGLTSTEIVESIMQLIPYTGFPRVQNALMVAKKVLAQRDVQ